MERFCYLCGKDVLNDRKDKRYYGDGKGKFWCFDCHDKHVKNREYKKDVDSGSIS